MGKTKKSLPKMIRPKTSMKAVKPDSEAFKKAVRKQRKKFSHFVFTETAPAMKPCNFVNEALVTNNGLKDKNLSYVYLLTALV